MLNSIYELVTALVIALVGLTLSADANVLYAQSQGPSQRRPAERGIPNFNGLDLTEEQKASLGSIRQTEREQIEAIRNNSSLSQEEKRTQIQAIQQTTRQQSQAVLTPEQQQVLTDRRANGPGREGNLGLTGEQKQSLQTIRQNEREQIQTIKNDQSLTDEQRRSQIQSIRQNTREQSQSVLTPEQQQSIQNRRNQGSRNGRPGMGGRSGGGMGGSRPGGGRRGGRP